MMLLQCDEGPCADRSLTLLMQVRDACAFAPGLELHAALVLLKLSAPTGLPAKLDLHDLASGLDLRRAASNRLIDFLAEIGMIELGASDSGVVSACLTAQGRQVAVRLMSVTGVLR